MKKSYNFTNGRDAHKFANAQGGPISIDVENPSRGIWIVTIISK